MIKGTGSALLGGLTAANGLAIVVLSLALVLPASNSQSPAGGSTGFIEKFEVPEHDDAGNLKWKLKGDKALIRADGLMNVINARAEFYSSNKVAMVFTAPTCLLDRINKRATTDGPVRIEGDNLVLTGVGAEWSDQTGGVVVRSNVRLVLSGGQQLFGLPGEKE